MGLWDSYDSLDQGGRYPLSSLAQFIPAMSYNFKGIDLSNQKNLTGQINNVANASYDMDNPLYQQIYGQQRAAGQQDLAAAIAEISRQNRKLTSVGRSPLLDSERGGEDIFRTITQGYQDVGNQAQNSTFGILNKAQGALSGALNAQNTLSGLQDKNQRMKLAGYGNISGALKSLFGL